MKKRYNPAMVAKLTVIVFIILCLQAGFTLMLVPWVGVGVDWGSNYFLVSLAQKAGIPALQTAVSSGWARGAVTALGVLNILIAIWEILNFNQSVKIIETGGDGTTGNASRK